MVRIWIAVVHQYSTSYDGRMSNFLYMFWQHCSFHNIDGISDIIPHYSIHGICYPVDEEVNQKKQDIDEEV